MRQWASQSESVGEAERVGERARSKEQAEDSKAVGIEGNGKIKRTWGHKPATYILTIGTRSLDFEAAIAATSSNSSSAVPIFTLFVRANIGRDGKAQGLDGFIRNHSRSLSAPSDSKGGPNVMTTGGGRTGAKVTQALGKS